MSRKKKKVVKINDKQYCEYIALLRQKDEEPQKGDG